MDGAVTEITAGRNRGLTLATTTLAVPNMHCGGCMRKVETALATIPGVISARAHLSAKRVSAVHRPGEVPATQLVEALERAGFVAAELTAASCNERAATDQDLARRLGVAGFAAANIMLLSGSVWSSR